MTVNRNNYEEFFLLYVDQELSDADRKAVEIFVRENPDMQQELSMLQDTRIRPDDSVSYADKEALLRPITNDFPVGLANIRELFLLYVDDELDGDERRSVEDFAAKHPQLQHELKLLKQTVIEPDIEVKFERKEELYRKEKDRVVDRFHWIRYASAAIFLIIAGFLAFEFFSKHEPGKSVADARTRTSSKTNQSDKKDSPSVTQRTTDPLYSNKSTAQVIPGKNERTPEERKQRQKQVTDQQVATPDLVVNPSARSIDQHELAVADKNKIETDQMIAAVNPSANQIAVIGQSASTRAAEKHESSNDFKTNLAMQNMVSETGDGFSVLSTTNGKNKMRGLFRKVSRVFEKTTKIDDEERNRELLIGNFQIALK